MKNTIVRFICLLQHAHTSEYDKLLQFDAYYLLQRKSWHIIVQMLLPLLQSMKTLLPDAWCRSAKPSTVVTTAQRGQRLRCQRAGISDASAAHRLTTKCPATTPPSPRSCAPVTNGYMPARILSLPRYDLGITFVKTKVSQLLEFTFVIIKLFFL